MNTESYQQNALVGSCPICDSAVEFLELPMISELVDCPGCETELEVISVVPLVLNKGPEFKEDWGE